MIGMTGLRYDLWQKYMARKGYVWDGFKAPEQTPDVRSDSVLALLEIVEELADKVDRLNERVLVLESIQAARTQWYGDGGRP